MTRLASCLGSALAALLFASASQAATVELTLITHAGPVDVFGHPGPAWELYASASAGDNAGIAGVNIDLVGLGASGTLTANAPQGLSLPAGSSGLNVGFTVGNADDAGDAVTFFAGQVGGGPALDDPATILFGVGQAPGTIPDLVPGSETGVPWAAPVLLAFGTMDGPAWATMGFGASTNANVWSQAGSLAAEAAVVNLLIERHPVPEPALLSILACAALGLVALRRT